MQKPQSQPVDNRHLNPRCQYHQSQCQSQYLNPSPIPSPILLYPYRSLQSVHAVTDRHGRYQHTNRKYVYPLTASHSNQQMDDGASTLPGNSQSIPQRVDCSYTGESN